MARLKYGLSGLNPSGLVTKAEHVISKMTGNSNFTTPDPTIAAVQTATDNLSDAIQAALDGGKDRTADRKAKAATLKGLLNEMGDYVQKTSKGDADKILSSGFEIVQQGSAIGQPGKPGGLVANTGSVSGTLDALWGAVRGATEYIIEMNTADPNNQALWKVAGYSSKSRYKATGLNSLSVYWVRVCALGAGGKGPYSDPARGVTQ